VITYTRYTDTEGDILFVNPTYDSWININDSTGWWGLILYIDITLLVIVYLQ